MHDSMNLTTSVVLGGSRGLSDGFPHDHALNGVPGLDSHDMVVVMIELTVQVVSHLRTNQKEGQPKAFAEFSIFRRDMFRHPSHDNWVNHAEEDVDDAE